MSRALLCLAIAFVACAPGPQGPQGAPGPEGARGATGPGFTQPPSISFVAPRSAIRGERVDVALSGFATAWSTPRVDFGPDVTVNSVSVASPTALLVNVTVTSAAALGARTISVTQDAQVASFRGFEVQDPVSLRLDGFPAQGSLVRVVITLRDARLTPSTADVQLTVPGAMGVGLVGAPTVDGRNVVASFGIDAQAMPGKRSLELRVRSSSGPVTVYTLPDALDVSMREATSTTLDMPLPLPLNTPFETALVAFAPAPIPAELFVTATSDVDGGRPLVAVLSPTGAYSPSTSFSATQFLDFSRLDAGVAYLAVQDGAGYGSTITLARVPPFAEAEPNGSAASANTITVPTRFTAQLDTDTDEDWYQFSGAGLAGQRLHVALRTDGGVDVGFEVRQDNTSLTGGVIDEDSRLEEGTVTLRNAQPVFVRVTPYTFTDPGPYRLELGFE